MDTFMCSSWYHLRYLSPNYDKGPFDPREYDYWMPVDVYTGGIEHANMHLIYTRFFHKALRDIGITEGNEPMLQLRNQGMVLGEDSEKMSKSRGNVVNPDDYVERYGADTVRGYLMFIGPWELGGPWDPSAIEGVSRFLHRVWAVIVDAPSRPASGDPGEEEVRNLERKLHQTIIKVTDDMQNFRFNTAIAALMEMNNWLVRTKDTAIYDTPAWREAIHNIVLLMAPIFPHISEELWHYLGHTESIHLQAWPQADAEKAREEEIAIVVQVNGKVRDKLVKAPGTAQDVLEREALELPNVGKWIEGKQVRKVIVVPDKLVNIVAG